MELKGARIVVLSCFLIHCSISANLFLFQEDNSITEFIMLVHFGLLLVYPVLGLIADSLFSRYMFIKMAAVLLMVSSTVGTVLCLIIDGLTFTNDRVLSALDITPGYLVVITAVLFLAMTTAIGMFEATAVQFGMDQMMEASSDQLSAFIHWYYLAMNTGIGVMALIMLVVGAVISSCVVTEEQCHSARLDVMTFMYILSAFFLVQFLCSVGIVLVVFKCKQHFSIQPARHAPYTTIYKVLKYAWKHKVPERRSAFTYWEEDIPSRIDLGKVKYGGPFTVEQVEDVKTFFWLLILLVSMFGFHLADDDYSAMRQLYYKLCPQSVVYAAYPALPNVLSVITVVVCVPLVRFVILPHCHKCVPNLLHRLGIGLTIIFFQELADLLIVYCSLRYYNTCSGQEDPNRVYSSGPIRDCTYTHFYVIRNNTCVQLCSSDSYCSGGEELFWGLFVSISAHTLAYHLVFLTTLEFICAQAPVAMKGLFVCVWYSLSSLHYLVYGVVVFAIGEDKVWLIFNGVKAFLVLLSVISFCCVSKCYVYRERDEVVNEQYLVEEIYDRELRHAEKLENDSIEEEERTPLLGISECSSQSVVDSY